MTKAQWNYFSDFRNEFKSYCSKMNEKYSGLLAPLQIESRKKDTPEYPLENSFVYNTALDDFTENSEIKLIVIGDNPGKDEQLSKNQKYLVGQSGKIAAGFFAKNPELQIDFRKNAIILNKTPVHTAKTQHLKFLQKNGGKEIQDLILSSQLYMAEKTALLHKNLLENGDGIFPEIWLVGYSELNKLFEAYKSGLKQFSTPASWEKVFIFQHFSMNRFSIDLKNFRTASPSLSLIDSIHQLGKLHKAEFF